jgi:hypothetical protein
MKNLCFLSLLFLFPFTIFSQDIPRMGLLLDDEAYEDVPMKARNVAFQDVVGEQPRTSLRKFLPTIRNQKGYGTCVGWSAAYYGRTILNARRRNMTDKMEIDKNAYSPVFTYLNANVDDDYNCQGGAFIGKAMQTMVEMGTPYFNEYDVLCDTTVPDALVESAKQHKIKDFTRLYGSDETNIVKIESVKRSLLNGNPVIIGFMVQNSFYSAKNVFEPDGGDFTGGHAMCVIGYDDDKYGGSFEIVNSWGTNWGNEGLMWVRYDDFANNTRYAFEMIPQKKIIQEDKKEKKMLSGQLDLKLYDGNKMEVSKGKGDYKKTVLGWQDVVMDEDLQSIGDYSTKIAFPINTRYRMYAKVNKPAYVYVIGADSNGDSGVLFPHKEEISPYIAYENTSVIVPGEKYWFRLNSDVESDYSVVIFSENKVDVNEAKQRLDSMEGDLMDKLYIIFKDELISKENVKLSDGKMGFNAEYEKGTMALMVLDIKRS